MTPLYDYLITALVEAGVKHTFGLPGDFVVTLYDLIERDGRIKPIVMTHEPGAGFAADAYARVKGLGVVLVTYCVGGLNCVNAVAQAYAEKSPVLVISGGPGIAERKPDALLHHRVKTFETQRNVFAEVCCRASVIHSASEAPRVISETIAAIRRLNRPGFIEIPRDLFKAPVPKKQLRVKPPRTDPEALAEAVAESVEMLNAATDPVIVVGIEVHRLRLAEKVRHLARKINVPLVSTLEAKSVLSEKEVLGVYAGALSSSNEVRERVERSDCLLWLGAFMTEFNLGVYTAHLDPRRTISVSNEGCRISHHTYPGVLLEPFLDVLLADASLKRHEQKNAPMRQVAPRPIQFDPAEKITVRSLYALLDERLKDEHIVVCDVGDCLFAAIGLHIPEEAGLLAPANYTSMGFGVPGAVGAQLAAPRKRPIVLVGDGGFQMTGAELATAVKYGLNPIVIVLNNGCFLTLSNVVAGPFTRITRWDYAKFAEAVGCRMARKVQTVGEFTAAFDAAEAERQPALIDVILNPTDQSEILARFSEELAKRAQSGAARTKSPA